MSKSAISNEEAKQFIWSACERRRGTAIGEHCCEAILEVLLWATCNPTSTEKAVGYFDAMQGITDESHWNAVEKLIDEQCNRPEDRFSSLRRLTPREVEELRAELLPLGRILVNGSQPERRTIVEALLTTRQEIDGRRGGQYGCSYSMGRLWRELVKEDCREPIACLFSMGAGVAPYLADKHQVVLHSAILEQERWLRGILKLLGGDKPAAAISPAGGWATAIAAPAWRENRRELLTTDPWLAGATVTCPEAIRDMEARRIFTAHQLCANKTFALVSPAIGFSGSKDIEYFRSEIVQRNWLDAVIELPPGSHPGTSIGGILLVLSHNRVEDSPVTIISAEGLLVASSSRAGKEVWSQQGTEELVKAIRNPIASEFCALVTKEELKDNGYKLQALRYLKSEDDTAIKRYLDSRETLQLGDLAEIKRPPATLGKRAEQGISVREVTLNDIGDAGVVEEGGKVIQIEESALAKGRAQLLEEGDVLLSIKGSVGKASVVGKLKEPTIPGQAFCVIRLRANAPISSDALVQYLRCDLGQSFIQKSLQGTGVSFIPMGEVKGLPIVLPTEEEKESSKEIRTMSQELSLELQQLTLKLQEIASKGWLEELSTG